MVCRSKIRSMCAKGISLDVIRSTEGTRWDGVGGHGTRWRERMIKRRVRRRTDTASGREFEC